MSVTVSHCIQSPRNTRITVKKNPETLILKQNRLVSHSLGCYLHQQVRYLSLNRIELLKLTINMSLSIFDDVIEEWRKY